MRKKFSARIHLYQLLVITLFLWPISAAYAANITREAEIRYAIQQSQSADEVVELQADGLSFIGLYRETPLPVKQGGTIILHDLSQNPDSPNVVRPLRTKLPDSAWDTLSVQLPIPSQDSSTEDYEALLTQALPRINAAIGFFASKNNSNLVLVGHGFGAAAAARFLSEAPNDNIQALALISMNDLNQSKFSALEKISVPTLDVYGSEDLGQIRNNAENRKRAITQKARNNNFRQVSLEGADHNYVGLEPSLLNIIRAWFGKHVAGSQVNVANSGPVQ